MKCSNQPTTKRAAPVPCSARRIAGTAGRAWQQPCTKTISFRPFLTALYIRQSRERPPKSLHAFHKGPPLHIPQGFGTTRSIKPLKVTTAKPSPCTRPVISRREWSRRAIGSVGEHVGLALAGGIIARGIATCRPSGALVVRHRAAVVRVRASPVVRIHRHLCRDVEDHRARLTVFGQRCAGVHLVRHHVRLGINQQPRRSGWTPTPRRRCPSAKSRSQADPAWQTDREPPSRRPVPPR